MGTGSHTFCRFEERNAPHAPLGVYPPRGIVNPLATVLVGKPAKLLSDTTRSTETQRSVHKHSDGALVVIDFGACAKSWGQRCTRLGPTETACALLCTIGPRWRNNLLLLQLYTWASFLLYQQMLSRRTLLAFRPHSPTGVYVESTHTRSLLHTWLRACFCHASTKSSVCSLQVLGSHIVLPVVQRIVHHHFTSMNQHPSLARVLVKVVCSGVFGDGYTTSARCGVIPFYVCPARTRIRTSGVRWGAGCWVVAPGLSCRWCVAHAFVAFK